MLKNYKLLLSAMVLFFTYGYTFSRSYPLKYVSKIECKFTPWSEHSQDCKTPLPTIQNANYKNYKDNVQMRLIYSVMWWATYKWGWDVWFWSHLGTDIATAEWTPVYAIWDWKVIIAKKLSWRWNAIVIRHYVNWKPIYSTYNHLSEISISNWDDVKEWQLIWKVWHTWNSWWNHLHFQIDINEKWSHPYYYTKCNWSSWEDVVNKWLCREDLLANTIDPIVFLETNWANIDAIKDIQDTKEVIKQNEKQQEENKIKPTEIVSREVLMMTELQMFMARYKISWESKIPANLLYKWENWQIILNVFQDTNKKVFNWSLPNDLEVEFDKKIVSILPTSVKYIDRGQRPIEIKALSPGTTKINFKINWKIIQSFDIRVVKDKSASIISSAASINIFKNIYIWWENWWAIIMKDWNWKNIISVPYEWNYTLKVEWNAKICGANISYKTSQSSASLNSLKCYEWKNELTYSYSNTLKWIYVFKLIPFASWKNKLSLFKSWKQIAVYTINSVKKVSDLDKTWEYKKYIEDWLKKMILRIDDTNWKFLPDDQLRESDATYWIKNAFPNAKSKNWQKFKRLTRLEFMKLINEMTWIKSLFTWPWFRDITNTSDLKYINILIDYNARFIDKFWKNYFQPNNKITRAEASYIIMKMISK